jgi:rRNA maturation RNase YbeY
MLEIYTSQFKEVFKTVLKAALKHFKIKEEDIEIELDFLSPDEIKDLNNEARGVDAVTDVLSFPCFATEEMRQMRTNCGINFKTAMMHDINPETGAVLLGEIYICKERAEEQAKKYNHSIERELAFLSVHGFLHLLGFDHSSEAETEGMERVQEKILADAGFLRGKREEIRDKRETNDVDKNHNSPHSSFASLKRGFIWNKQ